MVTNELTPVPAESVLGYALVTVAGNERLEPIIHASPVAIDLLIRTDLSCQLGDTLSRVRLFTRGSCCFDGTAIVRGLAAAEHSWLGPATVLTLELPCDDPQLTPQPAIDTYRDAEIIADTVANLVGVGALVAIERAELRQQRSLVSARILDVSDKKTGLVLSLLAGKALSVRKGQQLAVHVEIYGTHLALVANYRSRRGDRIHLDWPSEIHVWWRRNSDRLAIGDKAVEAELYLPITGELSVRPAYNLSVAGVALRLAPSDTVLVGTRLDHVVLLLGDGVVRAFGVVRNVRADSDGGYVAGISLTPVDQENRDALRQFIEQHVRCHIRKSTANDLNGLWPLWDTLGLFTRRHVALTPGVAALEAGRKALFERGDDLLITVVGTAEGVRQGSAELVRNYSHAWTLQHLGTTGTYLSREQLFAAVLEEGLRRDSLTALHALCDPNAADPLLTTMARIDLAPDEVCQQRWALLVPPTTLSLFGANEVEIQTPDEHERGWLLGRLAGLYSPLAIDALDFTQDELDLATTAAEYARLDLIRGRDSYIAVGISGPLGFALVEQASRGVSLAGLGDLVRLYSVVGDSDEERGPTLLTLAATATRLARSRGAIPLLLVDPDTVAPLVEAGYTELGLRVEIVLSRTAVARLTGHLRVQG